MKRILLDISKLKIFNGKDDNIYIGNYDPDMLIEEKIYFTDDPINLIKDVFINTTCDDGEECSLLHNIDDNCKQEDLFCSKWRCKWN